VPFLQQHDGFVLDPDALAPERLQIHYGRLQSQILPIVLDATAMPSSAAATPLDNKLLRLARRGARDRAWSAASSKGSCE
jgi:hypothetical protein